jgi:hypothetical protein
MAWTPTPRRAACSPSTDRRRCGVTVDGVHAAIANGLAEAIRASVAIDGTQM